MPNYDSEAAKLFVEAEKKASSKAGWFSFGSSNRLDDAADLYGRAANSYKLAQNYAEAGKVYKIQARLYTSMNEKDDAASAYLNASKVFRRPNPEESAQCLEIAIRILSERGRFQSAANHQKQLAEIYEEIGDSKKAMDCYQIAADWYYGENSVANGNNCLLKVATFAALLDNYLRAIEVFEQVANASIDNSLTRYSIREYFLKAGICHLCTGDVIRAKSALEKYENNDSTFTSTRECKFLHDMIDALEAQDEQAFTAVVSEWDRMTKLDSWKTTLLLKIKKTISSDVDFT